MKKFVKSYIFKCGIMAIFITIILSITIMKPAFEISNTIDDTLKITATNEKNSVSWGNDVRIDKIIIDGQVFSLNNITVSDNWKMYEDGILGSYKNTSPSVIKIPLKKIKKIEVEFIKQSGSGFVNIQMGNVNKTLDLYSSNENWEKYAWNYESESVFNPFYNIEALMICFILVYLMLIFIYRNVNKLKSYILKRTLIISSTIGFIQWMSSFYTDKFVFKYCNNGFSLYQNLIQKPQIIIYKIVFLILLLIVWYFIIRTYYYLKVGNTKVRAFLRYFVPYWIIMIAFLLVTWPGIWRWDEFTIIENMMNFDLFSWQHYITSIYYIFAFMTFPFPGGVVFVQITIISIIVGYIVSRFAIIFNYSVWSNILYIPFLLLASIDQNLYPLRLSLYTYLELLFFCKLIFMCKNSKIVTIKNVLFLAFLSSILAVWRSEGIFFAAFSPIIFYILFYKQTTTRIKVYYTIFVVVFTIGLLIPQQNLAKEQEGKKYLVTAYVESLDDLVKHEKELNPNSNLLSSIDKVMSVEKLLESRSGEVAFWNGGVRDEFTDSDFTMFKKAFASLLIKYPGEFIIERARTFLMSSGYYSDISNQIYDTVNLFDENTNSKYVEFKNEFIFNNSVNKTLRKDFISFIEGRDFQNYSKTTMLYPIIYNLLLPISVLLIMFITGMFKKRILSLCISIPMLVQFILVFLTAPGTYFMYYFPQYLIGYFFVTLYLLVKIYNLKEKSNVQFL